MWHKLTYIFVGLACGYAYYLVTQRETMFSAYIVILCYTYMILARCKYIQKVLF